MAFSLESHIKVAIALNCEDHEAVPSFHYRLPCCMLSPTTHPSLNNAVLRMLMSRYTGPRNVSAGQESSSSSSWNTTWPARVGTDCAKGHDCRRPWHAQRRQDVEDLVQNDMTRFGQSFENMSAFRTVCWHPSSQSPSRAGNQLPSASLPGTFSRFGKAKDIVRSSFRA
jgi:hypothetical protein